MNPFTILAELAQAAEQYPPVKRWKPYTHRQGRVDHAQHPEAPRIVALYESGWTIVEIAKVVAPSTCKVRKILLARGVRIRRQGYRRGTL